MNAEMNEGQISEAQGQPQAEITQPDPLLPNTTEPDRNPTTQRIFGTPGNHLDLSKTDFARMDQDADAYGNVKASPAESPTPQVQAADRTYTASRGRRLGRLQTAAAGALATISGIVGVGATGMPASAQSSPEPSPTPTSGPSLPDTDSSGGSDATAASRTIGMGPDGLPLWINIPKDPTDPDPTPVEGSPAPEVQDDLQKNIDVYMAKDPETGRYIKEITPDDRFHVISSTGTSVDYRFSILPHNETIAYPDVFASDQGLVMGYDTLPDKDNPDTKYLVAYLLKEDSDRQRFWVPEVVGQLGDGQYLFLVNYPKKDYNTPRGSTRLYTLDQFDKKKKQDLIDTSVLSLLTSRPRPSTGYDPKYEYLWKNWNQNIERQADFLKKYNDFAYGDSSSITRSGIPEGLNINTRLTQVDPANILYTYEISY